MNGKMIVLVYGGLLLYMLLPLISVVVAKGIAHVAGAQLDEGSAHPCVILGMDIGGLLYAMCMLGWLMIVTLPTGLLAVAGFSVFLVGRWFWG